MTTRSNRGQHVLHLDGSDPATSTASIDVKMDSVSTGSADRDGHLKSADFFRTEEFPTMTFRFTEAEAHGGDGYRITGDLTILGTTRPLVIALEFNGSPTDPFGNSASDSWARRRSCAPTGVSPGTRRWRRAGCSSPTGSS